MPRIASLAFALSAGFAASAGAADFDCVIQPRQVLEIRSPIEGLLERVMVDRGDTVRKGQELAFIDSSVERVLAEGAKYRSEMEGATRAAQSKVQLSAGKFGRAQELSRQKFLSAQAQEEALNEKQLAEAELLEAKDNRRLAEIEHRRQQALIRLKTVRSPVNGVVMERILNPGELVEAGVGRKPVVRLAEVDMLYVEALLPAELYRQLKIGMPGEVWPATPDTAAERATISVIDRVLDAGSGTFGVRLELPNKNLRLLAGLRCKVKFASLSAPAPAVAPSAARPAPPKLAAAASAR